MSGRASTKSSVMQQRESPICIQRADDLPTAGYNTVDNSWAHFNMHGLHEPPLVAVVEYQHCYKGY